MVLRLLEREQEPNIFILLNKIGTKGDIIGINSLMNKVPIRKIGTKKLSIT